MGRAPCCEKMGLKKGPWTPEEDRILISHIQKFGHSNWRALPKLAGLLRCGKSCRLRWINYLRPDIKRGNFTEEEQETVIKLHEMLGNRWSAIAAKLPGRTDNEIKNVWHTHLKKRLKQKQDSNQQKQEQKCDDLIIINANKSQSDENSNNNVIPIQSPMSPQPSFSGISTVTEASSSSSSIAAAETSNMGMLKSENIDSSEIIFPVINEDFWSEAELVENCSMGSNAVELPTYEFHDITDDHLDFWYNVFVKSAGGIEELL